MGDGAQSEIEAGMRILRRAYTIIEVVVVMIILGVVLAVTVPRFVRGRTASPESPQQVVTRARRTAIERAQSLSLIIEPNGNWELSEASLSGRVLAQGVTIHSPSIVQVNVTPSGICVPNDESGSVSVSVNPVSCSVVFERAASK